VRLAGFLKVLLLLNAVARAGNAQATAYVRVARAFILVQILAGVDNTRPEES